MASGEGETGHGRVVLRGSQAAVVAIVVAILGAVPGAARAGGITNGGSDLRDGWYADQPSLTRGVVTGSTFGRLWRAPVDGQVYAQPLVDGDTVLIATETNHVYGLDAQTGAARWERALGTPFDPRELPDACNDLLPAVGITGTPVVDQATHTAYFAHKTYGAGHAVEWWLDALDTRTGATPAGFPVPIGGHADNADVDFSPLTQMQRPGLLLLDGVVYVAFGGHCDIAPYQGWVFGVS